MAELEVKFTATGEEGEDLVEALIQENVIPEENVQVEQEDEQEEEAAHVTIDLGSMSISSNEEEFAFNPEGLKRAFKEVRGLKEYMTHLFEHLFVKVEAGIIPTADMSVEQSLAMRGPIATTVTANNPTCQQYGISQASPIKEIIVEGKRTLNPVYLSKPDGIFAAIIKLDLPISSMEQFNGATVDHVRAIQVGSEGPLSQLLATYPGYNGVVCLEPVILLFNMKYKGELVQLPPLTIEQLCLMQPRVRPQAVISSSLAEETVHKVKSTTAPVLKPSLSVEEQAVTPVTPGPEVKGWDWSKYTKSTTTTELGGLSPTSPTEYKQPGAVVSEGVTFSKDPLDTAPQAPDQMPPVRYFGSEVEASKPKASSVVTIPHPNSVDAFERMFGFNPRMCFTLHNSKRLQVPAIRINGTLLKFDRLAQAAGGWPVPVMRFLDICAEDVDIRVAYSTDVDPTCNEYGLRKSIYKKLIQTNGIGVEFTTEAGVTVPILKRTY